MGLAPVSLCFVFSDGFASVCFDFLVFSWFRRLLGDEIAPILG
jgi:hypothetical protein